MKYFLKKILKNNITQNILAAVAAFYIKICFVTARKDFRGREIMKDFSKQGRPVIFCCWHGRILMMPPLAKGLMRISVIISKHGDGRLISKAISFFNMKTISGSSASKGKDRGGKEALFEAIKTLQQGESIAITPDGPRGPRMRVKGAVSKIASETSAPVIPLTYSAQSSYRFSSWDRFMLPYPFSKVIINCGKPIFIEESADDNKIKNYNKMIEKELNEITKKIDKELGIAPTLPQ